MPIFNTKIHPYHGICFFKKLIWHILLTAKLEPDCSFLLASVRVMNVAVMQGQEMEGNNNDLDANIKFNLTK